MSETLPAIRLLKINGRVIAGKTEATISELKDFFARADGSEIVELHILSAEDRAARRSGLTWGEIAADAKLRSADLPRFL